MSRSITPAKLPLSVSLLRFGWRPIGLCGIALIIGTGIEWLDPFPDDRYRVQISPATFPSTRAVPEAAVLEGTEVLSLVVDRDALSGSERGIVTHPEERGREWERPGYVSYFTDGQLRLATQVGVRLHGGRSRLYSPVKSFRLHFRARYGPPAVPSSMFFGKGLENNLTSVIVHNDVRRDRQGRDWHLVNPLAYDIARQLGGIVPRTRPTQFYLNGERQGVYVLTERITREFLEARFGHRRFSISADGTSRDLPRWARTAKPFTMRDVNAVVDLDNLTSWALTVLFCGTTDILTQSPVARDLTDPASRWFWLTWDLDHSFMDLYQAAPQPWLLDSYRTLLGNREGRSRILTRLLQNDPDYRRYFAGRLSAALNHQITPAFLNERFGFYWEAALRRGAADSGYAEVLQQFLKERPQVLWDLSAKYLKMGGPFSVTVEGLAGTAVEIDGFKTPLPYTGKYLPGTPFALDGGTAVGAWLINGRQHDGRVALDVHENLVIASAGRTVEQSRR